MGVYVWQLTLTAVHGCSNQLAHCVMQCSDKRLQLHSLSRAHRQAFNEVAVCSLHASSAHLTAHAGAQVHNDIHVGQLATSQKSVFGFAELMPFNTSPTARLQQ
jgi:hypothetical protein